MLTLNSAPIKASIVFFGLRMVLESMISEVLQVSEVVRSSVLVGGLGEKPVLTGEWGGGCWVTSYQGESRCRTVTQPRKANLSTLPRGNFWAPPPLTIIHLVQSLPSPEPNLCQQRRVRSSLPFLPTRARCSDREFGVLLFPLDTSRPSATNRPPSSGNHGRPAYLATLPLDATARDRFPFTTQDSAPKLPQRC